MSEHRYSPEESPFGYPALMYGYPLAIDERRAVERVLSDYERRHEPADAPKKVPAGQTRARPA